MRLLRALVGAAILQCVQLHLFAPSPPPHDAHSLIKREESVTSICEYMDHPTKENEYIVVLDLDAPAGWTKVCTQSFVDELIELHQMADLPLKFIRNSYELRMSDTPMTDPENISAYGMNELSYPFNENAEQCQLWFVSTLPCGLIAAAQELRPGARMKPNCKYVRLQIFSVVRAAG